MKPLDGLRVVDLGIITAGASTSALLADLGAEVIKVEGPSYIDPFRRWAGAADVEMWWNASPHFHFTNRNKKSLCVDLKSARGQALLLDLVAVSDVVVENFSVGVLDRLGLGFDALQRANPRIVLGSVSSQGVTGPDAGAVSFGSTLEASSGFADLVRYSADETPFISGQALNYPDQVVSLIASGLIVATVIESRRTGLARHVDISQREVTAFMLGEKLVEAAHGLVPEAGPAAPGLLQGIFPSREGQWIAVSVDTDVAAARLCGHLECNALDAGKLKAWIGERAATDALACLDRLGVSASLARRVGDLPRLDTPEAVGPAFAIAPDGKPVKGLPWTIDGEAMKVRHTAPQLGEHNRNVVVDLLRRSEDDYHELVAQGVLAQAPA